MADRQLAKKGKAGVDNTFRRTWDKEDFAQRAAKREKEVKYFRWSCWSHHDLVHVNRICKLTLTPVGEGY